MPGKKESRRARTTPVNTWRRRSRTLELLSANENNETMIQTFVERHILRAIHTIGNQTSTCCVAGARVEGQLSESWSCSAAHGVGLWTYRRFMLLSFKDVGRKMKKLNLHFQHLSAFFIFLLSVLLSIAPWDHETLVFLGNDATMHSLRPCLVLFAWAPAKMFVGSWICLTGLGWVLYCVFPQARTWKGMYEVNWSNGMYVS